MAGERKWEYKTKQNITAEEANELGSCGWEMCGITGPAGGGETANVSWFKREVKS